MNSALAFCGRASAFGRLYRRCQGAEVWVSKGWRIEDTRIQGRPARPGMRPGQRKPPFLTALTGLSRLRVRAGLWRAPTNCEVRCSSEPGLEGILSLVQSSRRPGMCVVPSCPKVARRLVIRRTNRFRTIRLREPRASLSCWQSRRIISLRGRGAGVSRTGYRGKRGRWVRRQERPMIGRVGVRPG